MWCCVALRDAAWCCVVLRGVAWRCVMLRMCCVVLRGAAYVLRSTACLSPLLKPMRERQGEERGEGGEGEVKERRDR